MEWYVRGDVVEAYDASGEIVMRRRRGDSDSTLPTYVSYLRNRLIESVQTARYAAEIAGVNTPLGRVATDRASQAMVSGALGFLGVVTDDVSYPWKLADGTFVDLSPGQLREIAGAVGTHVKQCFENERRLVGLLHAATTEDELLNVDLSF
jgi:hypothetical protein